MDVCGSGHDEIAYNSSNCPLCEALERIEELTKDLRKVADDWDDARAEAEHYKSLLEEYAPEGLI